MMSNSFMSHVKLNTVSHKCLVALIVPIGSEWTNYPNEWRCDHGVLTIIIEVVVSHYICFWIAFFGMVRSNNDMHVFELIQDLCIRFKSFILRLFNFHSM